MGEAIRLLLDVQLRPEDIRRLLPGAMHDRQRPAEVVFYFGCNILRTPEIALTVLDVLERLGVDYEVLGSTGNCCGITFMRAGEADIAQAQAAQTMHNMAAFTPQEVLTWCPSCNVHMHDFVLDVAPPAFPMRHVTAYLVDRLGDMQQLFTQPVRKRVALHEHHGVDGVVEDVRHYPFAVQNFISLVGEAMGITREDLYKRLLIYRDIERVLAEAAPYIQANNVDPDLIQLTLPKELWGG
jgi:hypothetical protein